MKDCVRDTRWPDSLISYTRVCTGALNWLLVCCQMGKVHKRNRGTVVFWRLIALETEIEGNT